MNTKLIFENNSDEDNPVGIYCANEDDPGDA